MTASPPLAERLRALAPAISVGIVTADWMSLGSEVRLLESAGVHLLHFDVMDGRFCPMLTAGTPLVKGLKTTLLKDVHLLIEDPMDKVAAFAAAGADLITVHVDACRHPHRVLQAIGELRNANDPDRGVLRGIALNPSNPVDAVEPFLEETDLLYLVAVNPGWSGQKMASSTRRRIERLLELVRRSGRDILVGVDGGITRDNIDSVARLGADLIVTGSAVFDGKAAAKNVRDMLETIRQVRTV